MVKNRKTEAAILLETHMRELGLRFLPDGKREKELQFCPPRRWRFDYVILYKRGPVGNIAKNILGGLYPYELAVEIEGGGWIGGRHMRGKGFEADLEKYATATAMGYTVFRFSPRMILTGQAKEFLAQWLKLKETQ